MDDEEEEDDCEEWSGDFAVSTLSVFAGTCLDEVGAEDEEESKACEEALLCRFRTVCGGIGVVLLLLSVLALGRPTLGPGVAGRGMVGGLDGGVGGAERPPNRS